MEGFKSENVMWYLDFPERSRAPMYRATIPFLDQYRIVLIVFKRSGFYGYNEYRYPDYQEGEVAIRLERLDHPRTIYQSKIDNLKVSINQPKETFSSNPRIAHITIRLLKDEIWKRMSTENDFKHQKDPKGDSQRMTGLSPKNITPKEIFSYMRTFLQHAANSRDEFPRVFRDWEKNLFENDPTPGFEPKFRLARDGKITIAYEEYKELSRKYSGGDINIDDPILPKFLIFMAAFEPEHMESYFSYVQEILEEQVGEHVEEHAESGRRLDLKVELRWFVRYYNIMIGRIQKVDRRDDLYIDSYDPNDPFIKMLLLKADLLHRGYNEFCKSLINLTFHQSDFPEKYPLSWYRELFDDMNEEEWYERGAIYDYKYEGKILFDQLPLHLLKGHPEFQELAHIWEINHEDLIKLTNLCELLQRTCDNLSRKGACNDLNLSFLGFRCKNSKISAIALYSDCSTEIYPIMKSFACLERLYLNFVQIEILDSFKHEGCLDEYLEKQKLLNDKNDQIRKQKFYLELEKIYEKNTAKIIDNTGNSYETAIKITDANTQMGLDAEYKYLNKKFGPRGQAWELIRKSLMQNNGRHYDKMDIEIKDGQRLSIYFDIHDFFGVF